MQQYNYLSYLYAIYALGNDDIARRCYNYAVRRGIVFG